VGDVRAVVWRHVRLGSIQFEVRRAITTLVQPREPMTLFFVHGRGQATPEAEALLLAAIDSFHSQQTIPGH
jgi:hypothetical protein